MALDWSCEMVGSTVPDGMAAGDWEIGTVLSSPDPVLAEGIALSFDFAWIDMEHSALSIRDAQILAIGLRSGGARAFVRVPRFDSDLIGAVLDAGVDGLVAPKIESAAQARELVSAISYPPAGTRGFAPRRASGGRAAVAAGDRPLCVIQIETQVAIREVDAIAAVPGVDVLVVGTADLSLDLGVPLDMEAEALIAAATTTGAAAKACGKKWGVAIGSTPPWVEQLPDAGASMLVFSSDLRQYREATEASARKLRKLARATHA